MVSPLEDLGVLSCESWSPVLVAYPVDVRHLPHVADYAAERPAVHNALLRDYCEECSVLAVALVAEEN